MTESGNGFDESPVVGIEEGRKHVPAYYKCQPVESDEPDVIDLCISMGLDVKAYLVVESIAKLHRYDKKGMPLKDLGKALEQINRLKTIVTKEIRDRESGRDTTLHSTFPYRGDER
jgi:hypothetical protein